jgi:uncharacterized protein (TIGR00251 family)
MTNRINIKVIPNARQNSVTEEEGRLKVHVMAPAVDGKANKAVLEILAKHFKVKKSAVRLLKGELSREKVVEIMKD